MGITFKINFTKSGKSEIRRLTLDEGEEFSLSNLNTKIEKIWPGSSDMKITWKDNEGDDTGIATDEDLHESRRNTPDGVIRLWITEDKPSRRSTKDGREDWPREIQMWRMMANRGRRGHGRGFRGRLTVTERPPWLFNSEDEQSDVEKKEGEKHDSEGGPAPSTSGEQQAGVPMKEKASENAEDETDKNKDEETSPHRVQWSDKMLWWMPGWSSTEDENEDEEKEGNSKEDKEEAGDEPSVFGPGGKRGWRRAMRAFGMFGFPGWRGGSGRRGRGHRPWGMGHRPFDRMGHGHGGMGPHGMGHGPFGMRGNGHDGMGHGPHGMGHGPFGMMGHGHDGTGHGSHGMRPHGIGHGPFGMMGHGHGGMGHGPHGKGPHGMGHGPFGQGSFREGRECRGPRRSGCGKFGNMGPWKKGYQSLSEESDSDSSPEHCTRRRGSMCRRGMRRQTKMNNCRWNKAKMARFCSKKGSVGGCSSQDKPCGLSSMDGPCSFPMMQRRMMRRRFMRRMMARQMWAKRMRKMMGEDDPCDMYADQTTSGDESSEGHFKGKTGCPGFRRRGGRRDGRRAMFRAMFSGGNTSGSESEDTYDWNNGDLPVPPRFMLRQMRRWANQGRKAWPKEGSKDAANDSPHEEELV